jgi:hypothetical protein
MKRSCSTLGLVAVIVAVAAGHGASVHAKVIETLKDGCTVDVVVKVPYPNPDPGSSSANGNDIVLARSKTYCQFVDGSTSQPPLYKGVCQHDPTKKSRLTDPISYSSIKNSDRRFRWFCGKTPERSRCTTGTKHVRFRLDPDDHFETLCLDN